MPPNITKHTTGRYSGSDFKATLCTFNDQETNFDLTLHGVSVTFRGVTDDDLRALQNTILGHLDR